MNECCIIAEKNVGENTRGRRIQLILVKNNYTDLKTGAFGEQLRRKDCDKPAE